MNAGYVLLAICGSPLVFFFGKDIWDLIHEQHGPPER